MRTNLPLLTSLFGDRGTKIFFGFLLVVVVVAPILHLAVPAGSALHLSTYTMTLLGKYMTYALLAIAVDLVCRLLRVKKNGHVAFFALGGYATSMHLILQHGPRGVYGQRIL